MELSDDQATKKRGPRATRIDALRQKQTVASTSDGSSDRHSAADLPVSASAQNTSQYGTGSQSLRQGSFNDADFMNLLSSDTPQLGAIPLDSTNTAVTLDYSHLQFLPQPDQAIDEVPWLQWPESAIAQTDTRSLPFIVRR